jgi:hypothetical protein
MCIHYLGHLSVSPGNFLSNVSPCLLINRNSVFPFRGMSEVSSIFKSLKNQGCWSPVCSHLIHKSGPWKTSEDDSGLSPVRSCGSSTAETVVSYLLEQSHKLQEHGHQSLVWQMLSFLCLSKREDQDWGISSECLPSMHKDLSLIFSNLKITWTQIRNQFTFSWHRQQYTFIVSSQSYISFSTVHHSINWRDLNELHRTSQWSTESVDHMPLDRFHPPPPLVFTLICHVSLSPHLWLLWWAPSDHLTIGISSSFVHTWIDG